MPLAIGNKWIGQVSSYDMKGSVVSTHFDTLSVYGTEAVNGEIWFYVRGFDPAIFYQDTFRLAFTNRKDGLYRCDSGLFTQATRIANYPARSGDTVYFHWEYAPDSNGNYSCYYKFVDTTGYVVTVPAGTFSTYEYQMGSGYRHWDVIGNGIGSGEFYAPRIGPVQWGYFQPDGRPIQDDSQEIWQLSRAELH